MSRQKRMVAVSSGLIFFGSFLLTLTAGFFVLGRFETWAESQPRALASTQVIWPEVPPMTPLPSPTPTPTLTPGPPARVEIPKLGVKRVIVPVGTIVRGEQVEWEADKLFATQNRGDLVGHLEGTANPGQGGNIVLIGHNYNQGVYNWKGVFHSLHLLGQGDTIYLLSQEDILFTYQVEQIEKVPWPPRSAADTLAHLDYLLPTQDETLTLITCGGANLAPFPKRLYVTAKRVFGEEMK